MDSTGKVIAALLVGAAVGAMAGLLVAPDSGTKTRRKLSKTADDLLEDLEDAWEEGAEKIKELADEAVAEVEKYNKKVNESMK